jgi:stage V sporulation protein G
MQVTEVRLRKVNGAGRMRAIASITFNNLFVVHDLRVIEGNNGMFIAMPSRKLPDGRFKDVAHPICTEMREQIHNLVMAEFERQKDQVDEVKQE